MSTHPAIAILENIKTQVYKIILTYLQNPLYPSQFEIPNKYLPESDFHWQILTDYPTRQGKYIRGTLIVLLAQAMGADPQKAYQTAAAMQISEDWILIHDDYEDDSPMRRGKPALHKIYGDKLAVNAGDALHSLMWKILADNHNILGDQVSLRLIDEFYTMLAHTTLGQTTEINWTQTGKLTSDEDWYFIADSKTGYYSIAGPMRFGAIIGGATPQELDLITEAGKNLGRCFQLIDDLLDLTGNFEGLKKSPGDDILEGKRTLPLGHLLKAANPQQVEKIIGILAKPRDQKTESEVKFIIDLMHQLGSIQYAQNLAQKYRDIALEIIDKKLTFLNHEPGISNLKTVANFVLDRKF